LTEGANIWYCEWFNLWNKSSVKIPSPVSSTWHTIILLHSSDRPCFI